MLLSISFSRLAISTDAAILTSAARAVSAIESGEQRFERFRLDVPVREIGGQLPQIVLPVAAQQRIDLLFEVADGQRVRRRLVALDEGRFQLFDFRFLRRE